MEDKEKVNRIKARYSEADFREYREITSKTVEACKHIVEKLGVSDKSIAKIEEIFAPLNEMTVISGNIPVEFKLEYARINPKTRQIYLVGKVYRTRVSVEINSLNRYDYLFFDNDSAEWVLKKRNQSKRSTVRTRKEADDRIDRIIRTILDLKRVCAGTTCMKIIPTKHHGKISKFILTSGDKNYAIHSGVQVGDSWVYLVARLNRDFRAGCWTERKWIEEMDRQLGRGLTKLREDVCWLQKKVKNNQLNGVLDIDKSQPYHNYYGFVKDGKVVVFPTMERLINSL